MEQVQSGVRAAALILRTSQPLSLCMVVLKHTMKWVRMDQSHPRLVPTMDLSVPSRNTTLW